MRKNKIIKYAFTGFLSLLVIFAFYQVAVTQLRSAGFRKSEELPERETKPAVQDIAEGIPTGDDPVKEVEKIIKAFSEQSIFSISGAIKLYEEDAEGEDKLTEEKQMEYKKEGQHIYYRMGSLEYLFEKNQFLIVDHDSKVMHFSREDDFKESVVLSAQLNQIKKFITADSSEAIVTMLNGEKSITIINPSDPSVQQYTISYISSTYRITGISMIMYRTEEMEENDYTAMDDAKEKSTITPDTSLSIEDFGYKQSYYHIEFVYTNYSEKVVWLPQQLIQNFLLQRNNDCILNEQYKDYELNY